MQPNYVSDFDDLFERLTRDRWVNDDPCNVRDGRDERRGGVRPTRTTTPHDAPHDSPPRGRRQWGASAIHRNGILTVTIPTEDDADGRQIDVE
ncbi:MAG: hypothetical protein ABEJ73_11750 [Haloplanus sp.]